jgi:ketosteroid isomerase-like protein
MTRTEVEQIVKAGYAARAAKDLDAITRLFAPNGRFQLAGSPAHSPAATLTGETELRAGIGGLIQAFDFLEQEMLDSVIEGNKAAVRWRIRLKFNPSGEVVDTEIFDLWTIEGGRVASLLQFCDTALVARLTKAK